MFIYESAVAEFFVFPEAFARKEEIHRFKNLGVATKKIAWQCHAQQFKHPIESPVFSYLDYNVCVVSKIIVSGGARYISIFMQN